MALEQEISKGIMEAMKAKDTVRLTTLRNVKLLGKKYHYDFVITEIGGTIGDIESAPYMEAILHSFPTRPLPI